MTGFWCHLGPWAPPIQHWAPVPIPMLRMRRAEYWDWFKVGCMKYPRQNPSALFHWITLLRTWLFASDAVLMSSDGNQLQAAPLAILTTGPS